MGARTCDQRTVMTLWTIAGVFFRRLFADSDKRRELPKTIGNTCLCDAGVGFFLLTEAMGMLTGLHLQLFSPSQLMGNVFSPSQFFGNVFAPSQFLGNFFLPSSVFG